MTRARDRLYVAGFEGTQRRDRGCWYDLISEGLEARLSEAADGLGGPVRRMDCRADGAAAGQGAPKRIAPAPVAVPDWIARPPPHEVARPLLLNPSRLELPRHGSLRRRPRPVRATRRCCAAASCIACLSCFRPFPPRDRQRAGARFSPRKRAACREREREALLAAILAILGDESFGERLRAGQPGGGRACRPNCRRVSPGEPHAIISGQVDRLVCGARDDVRRRFQERRGGSGRRRRPHPRTYIAQLAAYRLALARLFPDKPVRAALLWTDAPRLMEIPAALLDRGETLLYESLRSRHLDLPPPAHQL